MRQTVHKIQPPEEGGSLTEMARDYRRSGDLIRLRIAELKDRTRKAAPAEKLKLERRIYTLTTMYHDTQEIALVLERYYDRRYRKNAKYSL